MTRTVAQAVRKYQSSFENNRLHRYRSWEHCYRFFQQGPIAVKKNRDAAALHLAFYLASWGMYRGSGFLLNWTYQVHSEAIDTLLNSSRRLWGLDFGADEKHADLVPEIFEVGRALKNAYGRFGIPTDTLITKVLLGTLGCSPACDRFFIAGFKETGNPYSYWNQSFLARIFVFCRRQRNALSHEQKRIQKSAKVHYPYAKLADMYFWQIGLNRAQRSLSNRRSSEP